MSSSNTPKFSEILRDQWRLLSFRAMGPGIRSAPNRYLWFGLVVTWLAGIGRYWDHPKAWLWQYLGLGSLVYVLVLASFLWLVLWPLRPAHWRWRTVLIFLCLTSLPALLYAVPVERFMSMADAQAANAWFLAIVAAWRVALLVVFLRRVARFSWFETLLGCLLPLSLIVFTLTALNLEHVVFQFMGGLRDPPVSSADLSYQVVWVLGMLSMLAAPVVLVLYLGKILWIQRDRRRGWFNRDERL